VEAAAFAGAFLGHGVSINMQQAYGQWRDRPTESRTSANLSMQVASRFNLFVNAARSRRDGQTAHELLAGLTLSHGDRTSMSVWAQRQGRSQASVEIQRSLPVGNGVGYRVRTEDGIRRGLQGAVQYQGAYGRYEAGQEFLDGQDTTHARLSGGLVWIGGGLHAAREVSSSYALIRVPDLQGVRAFANNQEIGRTGESGDVLVPNLLPYYANRLSIADTDVPLDRLLTNVERVVAPPYRGGSVVVFPTRRIEPVSGTVVLEAEGQTVLPALGQLTVFVGDAPLISPIGRQGEFYFDSLAAGSYPAVVQFGTAPCQFRFEVPASRVAGSVGVVRCVVRER
jgi:outer membrane usher protein